MTNCDHPILPGRTWCPRCGDLLDGRPITTVPTAAAPKKPSRVEVVMLALEGFALTLKIIVLALLLLLVLTFGYLLIASNALGAQTPTQLAVARAETFWSGPPPCGAPTVDFAEGPEYGGAEVAARAAYATCHIHLTLSMWGSESEQVANWPGFCLTLTHEVGHLELGPDYYAQVNPADPAHSPNEANVMYAHSVFGGVHPSTCFPATFTLSNGTRVRWTAEGDTVNGCSRTRHARHWGLVESVSGGEGLEYPSEARSLSAGRG